MRKTTAFYRDLDTLRDQYGETEYSRADILPGTKALFKKHGYSEDEALTDLANATLNNIEKGEDRAGQDGQCEFNYGAHVAIGDGKRIRRGMMNAECLSRRKTVIDDNMNKVVKQHKLEMAWIDERLAALKGYPITSVVKDVMPERAIEEALV